MNVRNLVFYIRLSAPDSLFSDDYHASHLCIQVGLDMMEFPRMHN